MIKEGTVADGTGLRATTSHVMGSSPVCCCCGCAPCVFGGFHVPPTARTDSVGCGLSAARGGIYLRRGMSNPSLSPPQTSSPISPIPSSLLANNIPADPQGCHVLSHTAYALKESSTGSSGHILYPAHFALRILAVIC